MVYWTLSMTIKDLYLKLKHLDDGGQSAALLDLAESNLDHIEGRYYRAEALRQLGRLDEAYDYAETTYPTESECRWQGLWHRLLGDICWQQGDFDKAQSHFELTKKKGEKVEDQKILGHAYNGLGIVAMYRGNLWESLDYYQMSSVYFRKVNYLKGIAYVLNNSGLVYRLRGELRKAISKFREMLEIGTSLDDIYIKALGTENLGMVYLKQENYNDAKEILTQSLELKRSLDNPIELAHPLEQLVRVCVLMGDEREASRYLKQLEDLNREHPNDIFNVLITFAKAFKLQASHRGLEKFKALTILENLVSENTAQFGIQVESFYLIIEILLFEFKSSGNQEVMAQLTEYLGKLHKIAQEQHMIATLIDALVFKARLALFQRQFDQVIEIFTQAEIIAKEEHLSHYEVVLERERKLVEEDLSDLKDKLDKAGISERLEKSRIEEYFKIAQGSIRDDGSI